MSTGGWPSFVTGSGRETSTPSQESLLRARQLLQQDENPAAEEWVGPGLGWRLATQVLPTRTASQPRSPRCACSRWSVGVRRWCGCPRPRPPDATTPSPSKSRAVLSAKKTGRSTGRRREKVLIRYNVHSLARVHANTRDRHKAPHKQSPAMTQSRKREENDKRESGKCAGGASLLSSPPLPCVWLAYLLVSVSVSDS